MYRCLCHSPPLLTCLLLVRCQIHIIIVQDISMYTPIRLINAYGIFTSMYMSAIRANNSFGQQFRRYKSNIETGYASVAAPNLNNNKY